jgi:hypothetical protein
LNSVKCTDFTTCGSGYLTDSEGTSTSDRTCKQTTTTTTITGTTATTTTTTTTVPPPPREESHTTDDFQCVKCEYGTVLICKPNLALEAAI